MGTSLSIYLWCFTLLLCLCDAPLWRTCLLLSRILLYICVFPSNDGQTSPQLVGSAVPEGGINGSSKLLYSIVFVGWNYLSLTFIPASDTPQFHPCGKINFMSSKLPLLTKSCARVVMDVRSKWDCTYWLYCVGLKFSAVYFKSRLDYLATENWKYEMRE